MLTHRDSPIVPSSLLSAVALLVALGGCSLLLDFEECEVDGDCKTLAGVGETLVCNADKYCVLTGETQPDCITDAECTEEGQVCVDEQCVVPAECVNSECAAQGENLICGKAGTCIQPLTEYCTRVEGPIGNDDIILLGSIMATNSSSGLPQQNSVALAVDEFNTASAFGGPTRVVMIACNDTGNADVGVEVARHLVDTVGVQAIVGPGFSSIFIDIATQVTVPAGVFSMSGSATSATITDLQDNDLAWRASASDVVQSVSIAKRIKELKTELALSTVSVLAYGKDDAYGNGLMSGVNSGVSDDASITVTGVAYPVGDHVAKAFEGLDSVPNPDIVLLFGIDEILQVLDIVETETAGNEPYYIFSDGGKLDELLERTALNTGLRDRIEGTAPGTEGANYGAFEFSYRAKYDNETPVRFTANAYDGTYLTLYAMVALHIRDQPITGTNIAGIFTSGTFTTGDILDSGPGQIPTARNKLVASTFDYEGASGPLDFDLATGEAQSNINRWVIGSSNEFGDCGLYEVASARWTIPEVCP